MNGKNNLSGLTQYMDKYDTVVLDKLHIIHSCMHSSFGVYYSYASKVYTGYTAECQNALIRF